MQNDDVKKPFGQIEQYLASYQVHYPSEDEISDTIETLRQYVPSKRKLLVTRYKTFRRIFVDMLITINFMSVSYWIITILLFTKDSLYGFCENWTTERYPIVNSNIVIIQYCCSQ